ncbi:MAG: hypothetical protein ABSF00_03425 [Candidatus Bathyarchaeia archaeon]|jgi:hypothetical protein
MSYFNFAVQNADWTLQSDVNGNLILTSQDGTLKLGPVSAALMMSANAVIAELARYVEGGGT